MRARRLIVRSQEFTPYGVVEDGSAERNTFILNLQGYLAATLLPVFDAWEGDMPPHLHKASALTSLASSLCTVSCPRECGREVAMHDCAGGRCCRHDACIN